MVDPVGMAPQRPGLLGIEAEDLDRLVDRSRNELTAIKVDGEHAVCVALECTDAFTRVPVPDLNRPVEASADQLGVVELQGPNR